MLKHCFRYASCLFVAIGFSVAIAGSYEDFFVAVANDDDVTVRALLQRGFDPNTVGPQGQMPLYAALQKGSPKVAEALWGHPALQFDAANLHGETPLMMAALRGNLAWCRRLAERGAAINREGWAPLHYAASGPDPSVVGWLLEHGAALEAKSPNGSTPLMMAAGYGNEASVDMLLAKGADRAARNDQGLTAADFASRAGRERLAQRLAPALR